MIALALVWALGVGVAWIGTPHSRAAASALGRRRAYWAYVLAWPYTVVAAIVWAVRRECGW